MKYIAVELAAYEKEGALPPYPLDDEEVLPLPTNRNLLL